MSARFPFPRALSRLRRFGRDNDGYATVEAVIVLPVLLWLFGVGWVYFDVFRQQGVNQKANYTIGDMLSRETDPINATYIDSAYELLKLLNKADATETDMRITVVQYNTKNDKWSVEWSEARGAKPSLSNGSLGDYLSRLPTVMNDQQLILVETWDDYEPAFQVGLGDFEIRTYSFTGPRYSPQIVWARGSGANNGFGNGDQDAPGRSLCNNNAENATDCTN